MAVKFNDDELDIIYGHENSSLSLEAKVVYGYLRRFMDYKTGLVGYKRVISYQSIREVIEYAPPKGSTKKAKTYTNRALMAILAEIERAGLAKWIKNDARGLFFECLLADTDFSAQKEERNLSVTYERTLNAPTQSRAVTEFFDDENIEERNQDFTKNVTPPKSVLREELSRRACEKNFVPDDAMQWVQYMVNEQGFSIPEAQTAKTVPMYLDWCSQKLAVSDIEQAIGIAHAWLSKKGESKPSSPVFYGKAVNQLLAERNNLQAQKSRDALNSDHGSLSNLVHFQQRANYVTSSSTSTTSKFVAQFGATDSQGREWIDPTATKCPRTGRALSITERQARKLIFLEQKDEREARNAGAIDGECVIDSERYGISLDGHDGYLHA